MKEPIYVCIVTLLAILIAQSLSHVRGNLQILQRIERMKANPSPEYEHYPNPDQSQEYVHCEFRDDIADEFDTIAPQ